MAKIANVASRTRESLNVVQDKTPSPTNAAIATTKRFTRSLARDFGCGLPLRLRPQNASNSWCTGKDSNLRTSLGGTDLQSVGFNHSPTCAKMPSLPALITQVSVADLLRGGPTLQAGGCPIEKQSARENPLARKHHTWKNSLWSAVGKNLLRRRAAQSPIFRNRLDSNARSIDHAQSNAGAGEGI
jgi:hypothetical protein